MDEEFDLKDLMLRENIPMWGCEHDWFCGIFRSVGAEVFYVQYGCLDALWKLSVACHPQFDDATLGAQSRVHRLLQSAGIPLDRDRIWMERKGSRMEILFRHPPGERALRITYAKRVGGSLVRCRDRLTLLPPF